MFFNSTHHAHFYTETALQNNFLPILLYITHLSTPLWQYTLARKTLAYELGVASSPSQPGRPSSFYNCISKFQETAILEGPLFSPPCLPRHEASVDCAQHFCFVPGLGYEKQNKNGNTMGAERPGMAHAYFGTLYQ